MNVDVIIRGGHVIDPENAINEKNDVAIKDGKIFKVGRDLNIVAKEMFDASGCFVTPGLIDAHVHCYQYATPLGVNPDETCLARGVTTVIDAGSAGASTFMGLKKYVVERSKTRVRCLLHIALHGLAASSCAAGDTLAVLDEDACYKCIQENRDIIVGVKVRLTANVCSMGDTEEQAFRRALAVAQRCNVPLMAHHTVSTIPTQRSTGDELGCPYDLRPGDIYTHTYHGYKSSILDPETLEVHSDVIEARARGVLFDVGHGAGAFNWAVAEHAAKQNFWPDLLGSDLHTLTHEGPAYDIPTVMTKFLHLGMPFYDIVKSATSQPAHAYNLDATTGSLSPGRDADVTVLKIEKCDVMLEDVVGQQRRIDKRVVPVAVWRNGERFSVKLPDVWPNPDSVTRSTEKLKTQIVKDKS